MRYFGGGYGRGEGGVYPDTRLGKTLYNDLDYFVFCKDPESPRLLGWLRRWERDESERLGIDVEGKLLTRSSIQEPITSMMFYDLVAAHRVSWGPADYLASYREGLDAGAISLDEVTRLLWNRGSGLLFAGCELARTGRKDFIFRQQQKVKLALGDAWLAERGEYHWSCQERHRRFEERFDGAPQWLSWHREAVQFKLQPWPCKDDGDQLLVLQQQLCAAWLEEFLALESRRLRVSFTRADSYTTYPGRLYPERPAWRNRLIGVRDYLRDGEYLRPMQDYPRAALQRVLVALIAEGEVVDSYGLPADEQLKGLLRWEKGYERYWMAYS